MLYAVFQIAALVIAAVHSTASRGTLNGSFKVTSKAERVELMFCAPVVASELNTSDTLLGTNAISVSNINKYTKATKSYARNNIYCRPFSYSLVIYSIHNGRRKICAMRMRAQTHNSGCFPRRGFRIPMPSWSTKRPRLEPLLLSRRHVTLRSSHRRRCYCTISISNGSFCRQRRRQLV